jgi:hypothetical protein
MTVFDLMDIYYPEKKRTISRLRTLDKKANQEAEKELVYRRENHIYPQDPLMMRNWLSEYAYATNNKEKNHRILKKLNELAAELKADMVLLETTESGYPMFKFRWFPYTMVKSHFELCSAFVAKLVEKASSGEDFY